MARAFYHERAGHDKIEKGEIVDEDDFLIATVEMFDGARGIAFYQLERSVSPHPHDNKRSVLFTLATYDSLETTGSSVGWRYAPRELPSDGFLTPGVEIVVGEIEHDNAIMWTLKSELDRQLLEARSTYYSIHQGDTCIWSGGLTRGIEPKIHSRTGSNGFPKELAENMWIEMCTPHDEEFSGGWEPLPEHELIQVWMRMQRATWVSSPDRQPVDSIAA